MTTGRVPGRPGYWNLDSSGDRIISLSPASEKPAAGDEAASTWITPGLFDIQINGIRGISFTDMQTTAEQLAEADAAIRETGVARYCPTILTRDHETTTELCRRFAAAWREDLIPGAVGLHIEGPFISSEDGYRGAHQRRYTRDPDFAELQQWQDAADGRIRIVTMAPERKGSEQFIRKAVEAGIVIAIGHSAATEEDVRMAADAGATLSTHLFNGCTPLVSRHRNPIFAQLAEDRLYASFIADGHHIPLSTLKIALRAKPRGRALLISDIVHLAGMPDGEYSMEGEPVTKSEGAIWRQDAPILSGAASTLDRDVELLAGRPEPGVEEVFSMATRIPARLLGMEEAVELTPERPGPVAVWQWNGTRLRLARRIGF